MTGGDKIRSVEPAGDGWWVATFLKDGEVVFDRVGAWAVVDDESCRAGVRVDPLVSGGDTCSLEPVGDTPYCGAVDQELFHVLALAQRDPDETLRVAFRRLTNPSVADQPTSTTTVHQETTTCER